MSDKVKILMGYTPSAPGLVFEDSDIIAVVPTGGTDHNGYEDKETIGVSTNQYGDLCLFRSSTSNVAFEKNIAICISEDVDQEKLADALMKLAYQLNPK